MATAFPTTAPGQRQAIIESVIGAMRELVPEETLDVAAVLPQELRHLWKTAVPLWGCSEEPRTHGVILGESLMAGSRRSR